MAIRFGRFGLQIPNFSYGTGVEQLFPTVLAQAREAESAGFDSVFVMDHFYQLPMLGDPDHPMLEAYTVLGALANATERMQLGSLVTGNTYRNPALLAKIMGFEFGTFTDRFNRLDEALQIILPMIKGERATFSGKWYQANEAMANPRLREHLPLMIGGSGEKKTIPLAARHFDHLNVIAGFDQLPEKLEVVRRSCEEVGRDPATLETSTLTTVLIDENAKPDRVPAKMTQRMVIGNADSVADQIKTKVLDAGVDGVIITCPSTRPVSSAPPAKRCVRSSACSRTYAQGHGDCGERKRTRDRRWSVVAGDLIVAPQRSIVSRRFAPRNR